MEINPIINGILRDINRGVPPEIISRRFHNTVIRMAGEAALLYCRQSSLKRVVMSGGCFQNKILLCGLIKWLTQKGISVYNHQRVPANDGGISLGQAVCAALIHSKSQSPALPYHSHS